jgi:hypothetical protein
MEKLKKIGWFYLVVEGRRKWRILTHRQVFDGINSYIIVNGTETNSLERQEQWKK